MYTPFSSTAAAAVSAAGVDPAIPGGDEKFAFVERRLRGDLAVRHELPGLEVVVQPEGVRAPVDPADVEPVAVAGGRRAGWKAERSLQDRLAEVAPVLRDIRRRGEDRAVAGVARAEDAVAGPRDLAHPADCAGVRVDGEDESVAGRQVDLVVDEIRVCDRLRRIERRPRLPELDQPRGAQPVAGDVVVVRVHGADQQAHAGQEQPKSSHENLRAAG
jgi:hypothetical protein